MHKDFVTKRLHGNVTYLLADHGYLLVEAQAIGRIASPIAPPTALKRDTNAEPL